MFRLITEVHRTILSASDKMFRLITEVHRTSTISYFAIIIISNDVFCFHPLSVSLPVSDVTSIGNMGAN